MDLSGFDQPLQMSQQQSAPAAAAPAQKQGLLSRIVGGLTSAPKYFLNTDIVNPAKEIAAQFSGNKQAMANADQAQAKNIGATPSQAFQRLAGNTVQLGAELVPGGQEEGLLGKIGQGAKVGGTFGLGQGLANNETAGNILKNTALGAASGGVMSGVTAGLTGALGKFANSASGKVADITAGKDAQVVAQDLQPYAGVAKGNDIAGLRGLAKDTLGLQDMSPQSVKAATDLLTGENGFINGTKQSLIGGAGNVSVSGVENTVKEALAAPENVGSLGDAAQKGTAANNLYRSIIQKISSMQGPEGPGLLGGKITVDTADASNVFNEIQKTESQINTLNRAEPGTVGNATKNVLQSYKSALMDRLSNGTGLNDTIKGYNVPPEDEAAFRDAVQKAGLPNQVADYGVNAMNNAKSLADVRAAEAPLVDASKIADSASKYGQGPGFIQATNKAAGINPEGADVLGNHGYQNIRLGGMAASPGLRGVLGGGALLARGAQAVANNPSVANAADTVFGGANNAVQGALGSAVGQAGQQIAPAAAASAGNAIMQQQPGQQQSSAPLAAITGGQQSGGEVRFNPQTGQLEPVQSAQSGSGAQGASTNDVFAQAGITPDVLQQAMIQDMQTTGGKNLAKLKSMYDLMQSNQKGSQPTQAAVTQIDTIQRAQDALNNIEQAFGNTSGVGKGAVSDLLASKVGGLLGGSNVQQVNAAVKGSLTDVAKALGGTGSATEIKALAQQMPGTSDTAASAKTKLDKIRNQLNQYLQQYTSNQNNYAQPGASADMTSMMDQLQLAGAGG